MCKVTVTVLRFGCSAHDTYDGRITTSFNRIVAGARAMGGRSSKPAHRRRPSSKAARQSSSSHAQPSADTKEPTAADANRSSTSNNILDLGNDILVEILSYLGSGRIEHAAVAPQMQGRISPGIIPNVLIPRSNACLARTVPFVNKHLRYLCNASDVLWMTILKRMLRSDPLGWEESVLALVEGRYHVPKLTATSVQSTVYNTSSVFGDVASSPPWAIHGEDSPLWKFRVRFQGRKLSSLSKRGEELGYYVDLLCQIVGYRCRMKNEHERKEAMHDEKIEQIHVSDAKHAVIHLALSRKVQTLPLLHIPMPSRLLRIGQITRLDASDPRHRQTLAVVTAGQRRRDLRCSAPLDAPRPRFVLWSSGNAITANVSGCRSGAHLVELHRCHIQQSGRRADLFVVPIERVRIIETEEREEEDGITDASFQLDFSQCR